MGEGSSPFVETSCFGGVGGDGDTNWKSFLSVLGKLKGSSFSSYFERVFFNNVSNVGFLL